jgi:hypothetical protein
MKEYWRVGVLRLVFSPTGVATYLTLLICAGVGHLHLEYSHPEPDAE